MPGTALTYEGLREERQKENVLSMYRKDLIEFLAVREFSTLDEKSVMTECYEGAHAHPTTRVVWTALLMVTKERPLTWYPRD